MVGQTIPFLNFKEGSGKAVLFLPVRQSCPLSPYLFILSAEILISAKAVRKNNIIKGICVNNEEIKLRNQYADDTTFILDGTKESLTATFHLFERFSLSSGLEINYKKK